MENNNETYCIVPADIASENRTILFRIPLYQRLFAWSSEEVFQLMEDLKVHFDKPANRDKKYYLGMLTIVKQNNRLDLIDGQQRMTALALLSIGFSKVLSTISGDAAMQWNKVVFDTNGEPRIYFNGRSEDRDYLKRLANDSSCHNGYVNFLMKDGLETILDFLTVKEDGKFKTQESLVEFAQRVYHGMAFFITTLPKHYVDNPASLNEYFEAMNSSGKSLEQHEILKVQLLRDQPDDKKISFTRLWNAVSNFSEPLIKPEDDDKSLTTAQKIEEQFKEYKSNLNLCFHSQYDSVIESICFSPDEGKAQSIANIPVAKIGERDNEEIDKEDGVISFSKFLLLVLDITNNANGEIGRINPSKLLPTFKERPPKSIVLFYHLLLECRLLLDAYVVRIKKTSAGNLHTLISRNINDEDHKEQAHRRLCQFQSLLDVSTEPHIWLLPFINYLRLENRRPTQTQLLNFLMIEDYEREHHDVIPNSEEKNPQSLSYDAKPRYWFWRLDYALWEKLILDKDAYPEYPDLDKEAIRQYEFRSNRSIEHLHPQNQNNNDEWDWKDVNSFGNLAMISGGFNSQQSNLPVHVKFANLEVQMGNKSLQSLKLYFMYLRAKGNEAEWDIKAKDAHAREMLEILNESLEKIKGYGQQQPEGEEL